MPRQQHHFPDLPEIGQPESYYANLARRADMLGDFFAKEAAKVGQYTTLALSPKFDWPAKLRYFDHALRRHCQPPPLPDEDVWMFFQKLADMVRYHAGMEALRLACVQDDEFAAMEKRGVSRRTIEMKAKEFFDELMGRDLLAQRPEHFNADDWQQLKLVRAQWIDDE